MLFGLRVQDVVALKTPEAVLLSWLVLGLLIAWTARLGLPWLKVPGFGAGLTLLVLIALIA